MSTIFKTRISQQEVQAPTVSADRVVADNFLTSSIQSESVASESINATTVQGEEIIANDLSTENIAISNDLSIGQDVIVPSGNVLVGRRGIVSFVDDGEEVDENGASGFPIYNGVPEVLNNSTVYNIGEIDKDIDLSNIRFGGNDNMVQTCEIWFSTPADTYEITWPENVVWLDSTDGNAPAIVKGTEYRIVLRKENEQIVASIAYAIGEGQQSVDEMIRDAAQKDGDNTFSGANTFTGSVDMSGAQVTPPDGWNVGELTAEQVQAVVPIAWSETAVTFGKGSTNPGRNTIIGAKITGWAERNTLVGEESYSQSSYGTAMGYKARTGYNGSSVGYDAQSTGNEAVAIGCNSRANSHPSMAIGTLTAASASYSTALGYHVKTKSPKALTIGSEFNETVDGQNVTHTCTTEGTGSITIGAGANTLNNGDTESSNSITIGCKALNQGADSVVIGASAATNSSGTVTAGAGAKTKAANSISVGTASEAAATKAISIGASSYAALQSVALGDDSYSASWGLAVGAGAEATGERSTAVGSWAKATALRSVAIGEAAQARDVGVVVFRSTAADGVKTQLYFSGANTPLANTYENGEAMMGYVVTDKNGNVMVDAEGNAMVGTQKLSVLFPNNRGENAFTPAMLGLDDEWTPKPMFRPSDLDMPQEEPTEPEEYQPLPVYPIVEPEIEEI